MIRREIGVRTIFNFLGPLANPAGATHQLLGVSDKMKMLVMAQALSSLGSKRVLVARGNDGLDEITLCESTEIVEVNKQEIKSYQIEPEDFSLERVGFSEIAGDTPENAARTMRGIFSGVASSISDLVVLNAGAALYAGERVSSILDGVKLAQKQLSSGKVLETLDAVIRATS